MTCVCAHLGFTVHTLSLLWTAAGNKVSKHLSEGGLKGCKDESSTSKYGPVYSFGFLCPRPKFSQLWRVWSQPFFDVDYIISPFS